MTGGSRSLPVRPSLRFLKLEAKRRLAAGEFTALHEAQAAVAREHGLPSWADLKQACARRPERGRAGSRGAAAQPPARRPDRLDAPGFGRAEQRDRPAARHRGAPADRARRGREPPGQGLLASQGRTVLVSSHLMSEMALTADHLIIIGRGRLLADLPTAQVIESSSRQASLEDAYLDLTEESTDYHGEPGASQ